MGRSIKQKEIIYETLKSLKTHPTIKELCDEVKKKDNSIGQATVYRNVSKLLSRGSIKKIQVGEDIDRYDGNQENHYHLICKECGLIEDIFDDSIDDNIINKISNKHGIIIDKYDIILNGVCHNCNKNK